MRGRCCYETIRKRKIMINKNEKDYRVMINIAERHFNVAALLYLKHASNAHLTLASVKYI